MIIPLDEVVYFDVITSTPTSGAVTDADSTPTFEVFEEATDTDIGVGGNLTKRTSKTGNYRGSFTASAANGFESGKWYSVIASATVGGVAGKDRVLLFRCGPAETSAGVPKVDASLIEGVDATNQIRDAANAADILQRLGTTLEAAGGSPNEFRFSQDALRHVPGMVRTELATELARIDVATSTRLASASYTAPLSAAGTRAALGMASADLDAQLSTIFGTVTAIAGYVDTEIASIISTLGTVDTNVTSIKLVADRLNTTLQAAGGSPGDFEFTADALRHAPVGAGGPTAADIADAVWDETLAGHVNAGSAGLALLNTVLVSLKLDTMIESAGGASPTDYRFSSDALRTVISVVPTAIENADALLNRDMSQVDDSNSRSPLNALRFLRNKWSISGVTLTVTKENDTTTAWTSTVATSAGADPVVGNDPA